MLKPVLDAKKIILILLLLCSIGLLFTSVDHNSRNLIDESFNEALIVFGSAKALNAVISLAQGTQIGVGVSISVGEVLDPINDLVEQFSWIMLAALTSLGIQKISMNFMTSDFFNGLFILSIIMAVIMILFYSKEQSKITKFSFSFAMAVIFLRFSIPLMSILNTTVYEQFVKPEYNIQALQSSIATVEKSIDEVREQSSNSSLFGQLLEPSKSIEKYKALASQASDNIIALVIAFVFQTILFPLLFLLILYLLLKKILFLLK